jgi:uncharacterized repeat protein (TIGR03803 family)
MNPPHKNRLTLFMFLFLCSVVNLIAQPTTFTGALIDESDSDGNSHQANFNNTHSNDFVWNLFLIASSDAAGTFINGPEDTDAGPVAVTLSSPGTYTFVMFATTGPSDNFDLNLFFNGDHAAPKISVKSPANSINAFSANSAISTYPLSPAGFGDVVPAAGTLSFNDGTNQITLVDFRWYNPDFGDGDLPILDRVSTFSAGEDAANDARGRFTLQVTPLNIISFFPSNGPVGTSVTFIGTNLLAVTNVLFSGVTASFVAQPPNQLSAVVPSNAVSGPVTLVFSNGNSVAVGDFTVTSSSSNTAFFTSLRSFTGADGATPNSPLLQASNGKLYSTTYEGGANGVGSIFSFTPSSGEFSNLFSFNMTNGALPFGSLAEGSDGNLYGTTANGGIERFGTTIGTAFRFTFGGELTTLTFFNVTNGALGGGGLIRGSDGELYGTTAAGGTNNTATLGGIGIPAGTTFHVGTNGILTTIDYLTATNHGTFPQAPLVEASDGFLYGTTVGGGIGFTGNIFSGYGSVFRTSPGGGLTLRAFFNGTNGCNPYNSGLIQALDGNFYGVTRYGGIGFTGANSSGFGTIYRVTTNGSISSVFQFNGTN